MCVFEKNGYDADRDYCIPEDENASGGVYVSLVKNPERFTGYSGGQSNAVWKQIYRENCFQMQLPQDDITPRTHPSEHPGRSAKSDLEAIMAGRNRNKMGGTNLDVGSSEPQLDNTCLEKRVFWRIISGMHTSISTHLCWDYLNQTTGQWVSLIPIPFTDYRRVQIWNVSSTEYGSIHNGLKISISITLSFSELLPSFRRTSNPTATVLVTQYKMHLPDKKYIH